MNILVVDDLPTNRKLLRVNLEAEGHRVLEAADGVAALEALRREPIDITISDVLMPRMDGFRLCQEIRKDEKLRALPFIIFTSTYKSPGDKKLAEMAGADLYLIKPAPARTILQAVADLTTQSKSTSPRSYPQPVAEPVVMQEYNAALVRKLEEKNADLTLQTAALETAGNAVMITTSDGTILWVNPAFTALTGFRADEAIGKSPRLLNSGEHPPAFFRELWDTILSGQIWRGELTNRRKDGRLYFGEQTITPFCAEGGAITHFIGIMNDVTIRKRAVEELRSTHAQLRQLLEHSPAVLYTIKLESQTVTPVIVSDNIERLLGVTVQESAHFDWWLGSVHPDDRDRALTESMNGFGYGGYTIEYRIRHKDGTYRWIEDSNRVIFDSSGQPKEAVGVWTDITQRKKLEEEILLREHQFNSFFRGATAGLALLDPELRFIQINDTLAEMNGRTVEEHLGRTITEVLPKLAPVVVPLLQQVLDTNEPVLNNEFHGETPREPSVQRHWIRSIFPVTGVAGKPQAIGVVVVEVTTRKRAEEALRASEERFRELAETIEEVFWITDPKKNVMLYISPAYETIWKRTCQSLYDNSRTWLDAIHPEDRGRIWEAATTRQAQGTYDEEYRILQPDGEIRWIRDKAFPVRQPSGMVERVVGVARDITDQRQLEELLRQSQKMEGIGQLAGGVAHDFNNILAAIMMQAELVGMVETLSPSLREGLEEIRRYAERAANLTRQLLLFSRKQVMQQREIDLNDIVADLTKMLQRIIGEDVRLQLDLHPARLITKADPGMLDQVLLNLAVNARDAMPEGGRLLIATFATTIGEQHALLHQDAAPGLYVCMRVTDTGQGISAEVLPHIFEPFFTTKEPGKGTGLGLATVFGIVQQHRGWIQVQSEPGHGASFQIGLPASTTKPEEAVGDLRSRPKGGNELILLVEDDTPVRLLTRAILERSGYRILEAANGVEALDLWAEHRDRIELVLTDLVMPGGVSGRQLAFRLHEDKPLLKIIFASGYSADVAGRQLELRTGENFLQKPFPPDQLLATIRRALEN